MLGIVGLPIPDELLMMYVGSLVHAGHLGYTFTLLISLLGSLSGMFLSFYIGHRYGMSFLNKYGSRIRLTPQKIEKANRWFQRHGKSALVLGYFVPGIRNITAYLAGINQWRFSTFFLFALPGALIWVFLFVTLGVYLGASWEAAYTVIREYIVVTLLVLLVALLLVWRIRRARAATKIQVDKENTL